MIYLIFSRQLPELHERALSVILCTSYYITSNQNLVDIQVFKQHMNDSPFLISYGVTQEMENIRGEISALRSQTMAARSQSMPRGLNTLLVSGDRDALTNPTRVKKLTKFFGDEPPLLRLFLKKLGYEVRWVCTALRSFPHQLMCHC